MFINLYLMSGRHWDGDEERNELYTLFSRSMYFGAGDTYKKRSLQGSMKSTVNEERTEGGDPKGGRCLPEDTKGGFTDKTLHLLWKDTQTFAK